MYSQFQHVGDDYDDDGTDEKQAPEGREEKEEERRKKLVYIMWLPTSDPQLDFTMS
jgi:hypothetical protein